MQPSRPIPLNSEPRISFSLPNSNVSLPSVSGLNAHES
jgi:hypothetical protein